MQRAGGGTRVEVLPLLSDIALTAILRAPSGEGATYGDVLTAETRAIDALAAVTGAVVSGRHDAVRLAEVLQRPEGLRLLKVANPISGFRVQVSDLVRATAELPGMIPTALTVPSRMITFPLGALPFSWQDRF